MCAITLEPLIFLIPDLSNDRTHEAQSDIIYDIILYVDRLFFLIIKVCVHLISFGQINIY